MTRAEGDRTVTEDRPTKVHEFKVKREALINGAPYFKTLLGDAHFKEGNQDVVDLHEDRAIGLSVWFQLLHNKVTAESYEVRIEGIWDMLLVAEKYGFNPKATEATTWFETWFKHQKTNPETKFDYEDYQMLLFPCHTFEYAKGFAETTKVLAYQATGHITERRPEGFNYVHLRLDQNIIRKAPVC